MGDNVVQFAQPKRERLLWTCNCGCTNHYHHSDGAVECCACGSFATEISGEWRAKLPEDPAGPKELDGANFKVVSLSSGDGWLRRQIKRSEDIRIGAVIFADGSMSTFTVDVETAEQVAWAGRKMAEATERALKDQSRDS